jgi:uncharacterized protein (DUF2235 family)
MESSTSKNIVVCLDGTANQLRLSRNTNVVRLFDLLDFSDESRQVAYYDPGVGTFSALGAWSPIGRRATRLAGLAFGYGLRQNLGEAYLFLMQHWQPGDRIFLFGFSRGAHAVRALAGLLNTTGMLHPHEGNLVPYAISAYTTTCRGKGEQGDNQKDLAARFSHSFARVWDGKGARLGVPVTYLGLWDTVEAAGHLRWKLGWRDTDAVPNAECVRHAVAIDESRWPYGASLVKLQEGVGNRRITEEEVWFPGVHSDVGGTFPPPRGKSEPVPRLSDITLKWVVRVDRAGYDRECAMSDAHAQASVNRNGLAWRPLSFHRRPLAGGLVHASARERPRLSDRSAYADEDWRSPYSSW